MPLSVTNGQSSFHSKGYPSRYVSVLVLVRCKIRRGGRCEPRKLFVEHIASQLDLLEGAALPSGLPLDLWRARCEDKSFYTLYLFVMRGFIE